MYKQIIFNVVYKNEAGEIVIKPVRRLWINSMGAYQADIDRPAEDENKELEAISVDFQNVFLQESTTKFDADGNMIFSGDIINVDEVNLFVTFADGSYLAVNEDLEVSYPLNEQLCRKAKKVGNIFMNSELVEKKIDTETVFQENNQNQNGII